jgi:hypothetical protein
MPTVQHALMHVLLVAQMRAGNPARIRFVDWQPWTVAPASYVIAHCSGLLNVALAAAHALEG